ncbi:MAG: hypothetical protein ABSG19_14935 [Candidatus Aminicenantales bacterium]
MANYRIKRCNFYTKAANRKHGPFGALLYDWMNVTPLTNLAGFLDTTPEVMAFESMVPIEEVNRLIPEFIKDGRIMQNGTLIWIVEFAEDQWPNIPAPTTIKGIQKDLMQIGLDNPLVRAFDLRYGPRWGSAWPEGLIIHPEKIKGWTQPSHPKKGPPKHE